MERLLAMPDMDMDAFVGAIMGMAAIAPARAYAVHQAWATDQAAEFTKAFIQELATDTGLVRQQLVAAGWSPPPKP